MGVLLTILIIIVVIIGAPILWGIKTNNNLIDDQTDIDQSWHQIGVQLQKRTDLIGELVPVVKGASNYESNTLARVMKYRSQMVHINADNSNSLTRNQIMNVSNQLSGALKSLFAVSERYPDLQANSDYKELMRDLEDLEQGIGYSRQLYNKTVATYDRDIRVFPSSIIANMRNFTKRDYLQQSPTVRKPPKIDFGNIGSGDNSNSSNQGSNK